MKKTTSIILEEQIIAKAKHISVFKNLNLSDYISTLIERDWMETTSDMPFAEQLISQFDVENKTSPTLV